jgi:hypothetical protein
VVRLFWSFVRLIALLYCLLHEVTLRRLLLCAFSLDWCGPAVVEQTLVLSTDRS